MQEEVYGVRSGDYSAWHRRNSTRRFVGIDRAQLLAMVDLDCSLYVEYDDSSKEPLALIETARDVGQAYKPATVTLALAKKAKIPCYVVLFTPAAAPNPADPRCHDIERFRVKRLWPQPEREWRDLSPGEYATGLLKLREWSASHLDEAANDETY
jgi:hypothetical protein